MVSFLCVPPSFHFVRYIIESHIFEFIRQNCRPVMPTSEIVMVVQVLNLLSALLNRYAEEHELLSAAEYNAFLIYAITWGIGGLLEAEDRSKFDEFMKGLIGDNSYPCEEGKTLFDYGVDVQTKKFKLWEAEPWKQPKGKISFSSILIPTVDSTRFVPPCTGPPRPSRRHILHLCAFSPLVNIFIIPLIRSGSLNAGMYLHCTPSFRLSLRFFSVSRELWGAAMLASASLQRW